MSHPVVSIYAGFTVEAALIVKELESKNTNSDATSVPKIIC